MPTIETTLSAGYQLNEWGVKEAIREIVSNAIDGAERGKPHGTGAMTLDYSKRRKVLTVANAATKVPTKALLMGTSESRGNDDCIGTFGEGLPMALLVMARKGLPVTIYNGDEKWTPEIVRSKQFDAEVLAIHTRQMINDRHSFVVEIGDIEPDEAQTVQTMFLRLDPEFNEEDAVGPAWAKERVLLDPRYRGKVYNKGVFVQKRDDLLFGYDLNEKLNRDRSIVDENDLRYSMGQALNQAVDSHGSTFAKLLITELFANNSALENQSTWSSLRYNTGFRDAVLNEWIAAYGPNTLAVASAEEVRQASLLGIKGVVAPPLLLGMITDALGSFSSMKDVLGNEVAETILDLTANERKVLDFIEARFGPVKAARFHLLSTNASTKDGTMYIARELLAEPVEAIKAASLELGKGRAKQSGVPASHEQLTILTTMLWEGR